MKTCIAKIDSDKLRQDYRFTLSNLVYVAVKENKGEQKIFANRTVDLITNTTLIDLSIEEYPDFLIQSVDVAKNENKVGMRLVKAIMN